MRYRDLFKNREFTALYVADVVSNGARYVAKIAVAALVYQRTHSTTWTAAVIAISYAPYLLSPWLSAISDHYPRKYVIIGCDVARAAITSLILIHGLPIWLVLVILFSVDVFSIPWGSSRLALFMEIFGLDGFRCANALTQSSRQLLQLAGFMIGGVVTAALGPYAAIALDAATYVVEALVLAVVLSYRPAPTAPADQSEGAGRNTWRSPWRSGREGLSVIVHTVRLRRLLYLLGIGPAVAVVAEGLAVPFAHELGYGTRLAGLIMAANPLGYVAGILVVGRLAGHRQRPLIVPLALGSTICVTAAGASTWLGRPIVPMLGLVVVSGACLAYLISVQAEIAAMIPDHLQGRLFGVANAVLQLSQGAAIVLGGLIATRAMVGPALVVVGGFGTVVGLAVGVRLVRAPTATRSGA